MSSPDKNEPDPLDASLPAGTPVQAPQDAQASAGEKIAALVQEKLGIAVNPTELASGKFPLTLILGLVDNLQKAQAASNARMDGILSNEVKLGSKLDAVLEDTAHLAQVLARIGQYEQAIAAATRAVVAPPKA